MGDARTPTPICPRCGYDLSGIPPTWKESCPLSGTCSECGMGFEWVDIYHPDRLAPAWSFEHANVRRFTRFLKTFAIAFTPARLWRSFPIAAPIRRGPLAVFAVVVITLCYLATALAAWFMDGGFYLRGGLPTILLQIINALIWPQRALDVNAAYASPLPGGAIAVLLWCLLIPCPFLILGRSFAMVKCRRVHLARAWACFLPVVGVIAAGSAFFWTGYWLSWIWSPQLAAWLNDVIIWSYAIILPLFLWVVRWWYLFVRSYLRMAHPRSVAALMITASMLLGFAIVLWIPGNGVMNDFAYILMRLGY